MKKIIAVVAFMFIGYMGFAQDTYKADTEKYMAVSGQMNAFDYLKEEMVQSIPESRRQEFLAELEVSLNDYQTKLAEVYMEIFSHTDIKELIKMYESPIGKKLLEKNKELSDKTQAVGMEWGMGLQGLMMKYMEE